MPAENRWLALGGMLCTGMMALVGIQFFRIALGPPPLQIGPKTTVISRPLDPDGFVDYALALNQAASKGVTAETNALVDLVHVFGVEGIPQESRAEYFSGLGILPVVDADIIAVSEQRAWERDGRTREGDIDAFQRYEHDQIGQSRERPWNRDRYPDAAIWLDLNSEALGRIIAASHKPHFFEPILRSGEGTIFAAPQVGYTISRQASRLLQTRAMLSLGEGRPAEAWSDMMAQFRLSRLVWRTPRLLHWLAASSIDSAATHQLSELLQSQQLDIAAIEIIQKDYDALADIPTLVAAINVSERFSLLDTFQEMSPRMRLDANIMLELVNTSFDEQLAIMQEPALRVRVQKLREYSKRSDSQPKSLWDEGKTAAWRLTKTDFGMSQSIGQIMVSMASPALEQACIAEVRTRIRQELIAIGFALAKYRSLNQQYPTELELLIPNQLSLLPRDPWTGAGYVYRVTEDGYLLYSIGANEKDDGGHSGQGADDVALGWPPRE